MKKFWKIAAIGLGSVVGLVVLAVCAALWLVFTPARLTPVVERQIPRFVSSPVAIDRVELTFFGSFPRLRLAIDGVRVISPAEGAPSDTLARIGRVDAAIDIRAFLRRNELILSDIVLRDGAVNLYFDSLGRVNYNIMRPAPAAPASTESFSIARVDVAGVRIENLDLHYFDAAALLSADIRSLSTDIRASMEGAAIGATLETRRPFDLRFDMGRGDSLLAATVKGLTLNATGSMTKGAAEADVTALRAEEVTVAYGGETYLRGAAVSVAAGVSADPAAQSFGIRGGALTLGDLNLALDGSVRIDSLRGIDTDLHYKFAEWPLERLLALIPESFAHYLDGISAEGKISSEGSVKGFYGDNSMPVIDAKVLFDEGRVSYPAVLPYPLRDAAADLDIHTDMTDAASYVTINTLAARTPHSTFKARGRAERLFSDPRFDVTVDAEGDLADAAPFIPDSLRLTAAGRISGRVNVDMRMSQLMAGAIDRMRLSGSLAVTDLDALYDTIAVATPAARLDFSLPNDAPSTRHTSFAKARLEADRLTAAIVSGVSDTTSAPARVEMSGARLALETSNVLDTLNMPAVVLDFSLASLSARIDTLSVDALAPSGKISTAPGSRNAAAQRIEAVYHGGAISGRAGDMTASLEKADIDASIMYDADRPDLWQQLSPRGTVAAVGTAITLPALDYPIEVPALAMDFTPEQFRVEQARVKLDESDFSLDGTVDNIAAYFRGDDILRAEFNFNSPVTNVSRLLALTSGLGDDALEAEKAADTAAPDEFTGPYMVPKGIDLMLHADIADVLWEGSSLLSNIRGDVQIRDGVLFITPEVSFDSPVTRGNIQMIYRTPAKNNLFAGVGIHLDRIDMHELVRLIPDLDNLMPMLRGFSGRGEFHAAVEGYMDSLYRFKMSTLRGAGSVAAVDLALKDEELFRRIAVLLKYKDEGTLRIDSMRAEFTVLRNEINLYPFLMKVDRYGAVISGRHNMNMNFDYNISLVESPLPFRVAVDVTGSPDDLKFKVFSKSRYPDFYRPRYEGVVENRQMELRNLIRAGLLAGRKKEDE